MLAFELRLFRLPDPEALARYKMRTGREEYIVTYTIASGLLAAVLGGLILGEVFALAALAAGRAADGHAVIVYQAIAAGLTAIAFMALFVGPRPYEGPPASPEGGNGDL